MTYLFSPEIQSFMPEQALIEASQELGELSEAQMHDEAPELITDTDAVFKEFGVPVRSFESARIAGVEGITKEFSVRRDDLVHQAAVAEMAVFDPNKVVMPIIVGDVSPIILRDEDDIQRGPNNFWVPVANEGKSQCIIVTGDLLEQGFGLGMLVADCPVMNVVITEKDNPSKLVAIAQTHNGWRQIADGVDLDLKDSLDSLGLLDTTKYDSYVSMSSGVAYGFEMDVTKLEEEFKNRGGDIDINAEDRTKDYLAAAGVGPADVAQADNVPFSEMNPSQDSSKMFLNIALLAYVNTLRAVGAESNERAFSPAWIDSLTSPARPSDRRAQVRHGNTAPERQYRMFAGLLPETK